MLHCSLQDAETRLDAEAETSRAYTISPVKDETSRTNEEQFLPPLKAAQMRDQPYPKVVRMHPDCCIFNKLA